MDNKFEESNEFKNFINDVVRQENINDYKISLESGSLKGDGYLGVITSLKVEGKDKSGKPKVLNFVVKSAPISAKLRETAPIRNAYEHEIFMYKTVFPTFRQFENEKGILNPFSSTAKCCTTSLSNEHEFLILENLKEIGYDLWNRKVPMNEAHLKIVLKEYGRFHALSLAIGDQKPELFKRMAQTFSNIMGDFMENSGFNTMLPQQCEKVKKAFDPIKDQSILKTLDAFAKNVFDILKNATMNPDKYSVILHGDCWCNNMMFKYADSSYPNKPTNVCFIDWQISRLGAPVLDLVYFFYCCASKEALDNLQYYQQIYYDSLSSYLKQLGSDPTKVYPFSVFKEQWKKHASYGLGLAMLLLHVMLTDKSEVNDLSELAESGKQFADAFFQDIEKEDVYLERAKDVVLHFAKNGFI